MVAVSYKGLWIGSRGVEFWVLGQKPGHWGSMEELPPWEGPESKEIGVGISSYPNQDGPPNLKAVLLGTTELGEVPCMVWDAIGEWGWGVGR